MSGYWAIGRRAAAMAPSRMMTREITQARTGRSMKKRANMIVLRVRDRVAGLGGRGSRRGLRDSCRPALLPAPCFPVADPRGRHVNQLRLHGGARTDLLQAGAH